MAWQDWQDQLRAVRAKFRAEAQLGQSAVDNALLKITTIDHNANIRQGLTEHNITQAQIAWEEQKTNLGVSVEFDPVTDDPDGLFGELVGPGDDVADHVGQAGEIGSKIKPASDDDLPGTSWSISDE